MLEKDPERRPDVPQILSYAPVRLRVERALIKRKEQVVDDKLLDMADRGAELQQELLREQAARREGEATVRELRGALAGLTEHLQSAVAGGDTTGAGGAHGKGGKAGKSPARGKSPGRGRGGSSNKAGKAGASGGGGAGGGGAAPVEALRVEAMAAVDHMLVRWRHDESAHHRCRNELAQKEAQLTDMKREMRTASKGRSPARPRKSPSPSPGGARKSFSKSPGRSRSRTRSSGGGLTGGGELMEELVGLREALGDADRRGREDATKLDRMRRGLAEAQRSRHESEEELGELRRALDRAQQQGEEGRERLVELQATLLGAQQQAQQRSQQQGREDAEAHRGMEAALQEAQAEARRQGEAANALQRENTALREDMSGLRASLDDSERQGHGAVNSLQEQQGELETLVAGLQADLATARGQAREGAEALVEVRGLRSALREKQHRAGSTLDACREELDAARGDASEAQGEASMLRGALERGRNEWQEEREGMHEWKKRLLRQNQVRRAGERGGKKEEGERGGGKRCAVLASAPCTNTVFTQDCV
jgi:hypothetical protein